MIRTDKRDIAVELLDAAVAEYLDHKRYFAAYNLAGVAEELLAKLVRLGRGTDSTKRTIAVVREISAAIQQPIRDEKALRQAIFNLKNSIKHMDTGNDADRYVIANIETAARQKIGDAVYNLKVLRWRKSPLVKRFDAVRGNRRPKESLTRRR